MPDATLLPPITHCRPAFTALLRTARTAGRRPLPTLHCLVLPALALPCLYLPRASAAYNAAYWFFGYGLKGARCRPRQRRPQHLRRRGTRRRPRARLPAPIVAWRSIPAASPTILLLTLTTAAAQTTSPGRTVSRRVSFVPAHLFCYWHSGRSIPLPTPKWRATSVSGMVRMYLPACDAGGRRRWRFMIVAHAACGAYRCAVFGYRCAGGDSVAFILRRHRRCAAGTWHDGAARW